METTASPLPTQLVAARRPFRAGEVVGRSFSIWIRNLVPFSIVALAIWTPVLLVAAVSPPGQATGWRLATGTLSGLASLVAAGALTFGVLQSLQGVRVPLGSLIRTGFAKFGRVFGTAFFVGFFVFLGVVLLVLPGVMAACALYVAVPAVVVERDLGSANALDRSRALTKGCRWGILLVGVVVFLARLVIGALGTAVLVVGPSIVPHPIPLLVQTALVALVAPLGATTAAVAYHDLRVAKEGVDTASLVKVFE